MASKGNSICPSSVRLRSPADNNAVMSLWTALMSRSARRAVSRIDKGPAPQRTLSNCQRFAVRTVQSNSGVAKLIRADGSAIPLVQADAKSAMDSAADRTSRITVFMVPPVNISLEGRNQTFGVCKHKSGFNLIEVAMIPFAGLVVISQDANALHNVGQSIFEGMS
jgi:hypothetical protein